MIKIPKQPLEYTLVGCVTFFSKETLKKMGYNYKNLFPTDIPVLVYSKTGELNGLLFGKINNKYKYINPEIIKEIYNLDSAQDKFPELFI